MVHSAARVRFGPPLFRSARAVMTPPCLATTEWLSHPFRQHQMQVQWFELGSSLLRPFSGCNCKSHLELAVTLLYAELVLKTMSREQAGARSHDMFSQSQVHLHERSQSTENTCKHPQRPPKQGLGPSPDSGQCRCFRTQITTSMSSKQMPKRLGALTLCNQQHKQRAPTARY